MIDSILACATCGGLMTWVKACNTPGRTTHCWRCPRHKGHKVWPRSGSFFEQSNLPLTKIVSLIFCWANDFPNHTTIRMVAISERHIVEWFKASYFHILLPTYWNLNNNALSFQDEYNFCSNLTQILFFITLFIETEGSLFMVDSSAPSTDWRRGHYCWDWWGMYFLLLMTSSYTHLKTRNLTQIWKSLWAALLFGSCNMI